MTQITFEVVETRTIELDYDPTTAKNIFDEGCFLFNDSQIVDYRTRILDIQEDGETVDDIERGVNGK